MSRQKLWLVTVTLVALLAIESRVPAPIEVGSFGFHSPYARNAALAQQPPPFVFTAPPANATFFPGQTVTIAWTGGDPSWSVNLSLIDVAAWTVATGVASGIPNSGSYNWTIPSSLPFGGPCGRRYAFYIEDTQQTSWAYGPEFAVLCTTSTPTPTATSTPTRTPTPSTTPSPTPTCSVTITKQTIPAGGTGFPFSSNWSGLQGITLNDGQSYSTQVGCGPIYNVFECTAVSSPFCPIAIPPGWTLTNIACTLTGTGSFSIIGANPNPAFQPGDNEVVFHSLAPGSALQVHLHQHVGHAYTHSYFHPYRHVYN